MLVYISSYSLVTQKVNKYAVYNAAVYILNTAEIVSKSSMVVCYSFFLFIFFVYNAF